MVLPRVCKHLLRLLFSLLLLLLSSSTSLLEYWYITLLHLIALYSILSRDFIEEIRVKMLDKRVFLITVWLHGRKIIVPCEIDFIFIIRFFFLIFLLLVWVEPPWSSVGSDVFQIFADQFTLFSCELSIVRSNRSRGLRQKFEFISSTSSTYPVWLIMWHTRRDQVIFFWLHWSFRSRWLYLCIGLW